MGHKKFLFKGLSAKMDVELANLKPDQDQNTDNRVINEEEKYTFTYAFKQQLLRAWQPVPT